MKKFGTFAGVSVPSYEATSGAVLFSVLPMLEAEVGWIRMLIVVFLANTATTYSIADCTTNLNRIGAWEMSISTVFLQTLLFSGVSEV